MNLLQIIFFSLFLGFALLKSGDKGKAVLDFCRSGQEAMKEITNIVLEFTPYGVLRSHGKRSGGRMVQRF